MSAPRTRLCMGLLGMFLGGSSFACVDKAPPATWPEPPPPVMAKPVGGEAAQMTPTREPEKASEAVEGTNDPEEGAVGLDQAPAEPKAEAPASEEQTAEPGSEDKVEAPAPNP